MSGPERTIRTVDRSGIRQQIEELLSQVAAGDTRVNVEDQGKTVAAIISGRDLDRLRRYDRDVAESDAVLVRMRGRFRDVDPEQIERDVAALVDEVRREQREQSGGPTER